MTVTTTAAPVRAFIAGEFRESGSDRHIPSVNPPDRADVVARVPEGTAEDVELAVAAAAHALDGWRRLPEPARAEHLYRWAGAIDARREELARAVVREVGKPI